MNIYQIVRSLTLLLLLVGQTEAASLCQQQPEDNPEQWSIEKFFCDKKGQVVRLEVLFRKSKKPSSISYFSENKLYRKQFFNAEGEQMEESDYQHLRDGSFIKTTYSIKPFRQKITDKVQFFKEKDEYGNLIPFKRWYFRDGNVKRPILQQIVTYGKVDKRIRIRLLADKEGKIVKKFYFFYDDDKRKILFREAIGFKVYDAKDKLIGSFSVHEKPEIKKLIKKQCDDTSDCQHKLDIFQNQKRSPVVIIDSGFDFHKSLTYKLYNNPLEKFDGIDNDENGIVDDVFGWHFNEFGEISSSILERPIVDEITNLVPFSHGTHVADIALKGLDNFALVGVAGDTTLVENLELARKFIKQHKVRFSNMSFGFGEASDNDPILPDSSSHRTLAKLITQNPQTLFTVAAGNEGNDLDNEQRMYPASFNFENLIVVGALDTDKLELDKMNSYKMAKFSNYGDESTDIFAPGVKLKAALMGGGDVRETGTSMAAPYVLNIALKVFNINPSLSPTDIKEILIASAYVNLDNLLPAVSKGIVHPWRAYAVAHLLKKNKKLSIGEAVHTLIKNEGSKKQ